MDPLSAYIPQDRYRALADRSDLPAAMAGTLLSADLVGFTPLTRGLVAQFGERRGADVLSEVLNAVYTPCLQQITAYGGAVIGFSGDGFLGWFPADDGDRAASCALRLQHMLPSILASLPALPAAAALAMRVALAAGSVRRFIIGDPAVQLVDVLAGALLDRLAELDARCLPGEIVLDDSLAAGLERRGALIRRRAAADEAVITLLSDLPRPAPPQPPAPPPALAEDVLRPWLLPQVFARLTHGQGEFLTELRPAVALFVRIHGLSADAPEAPTILDRLLRMVQAVITPYEGNVLQVTIGEKGSYLYCGFGAPLAHEDDALRAVHTARALVEQAAALPGIGGVACGISQGIMRTGAYGGADRRTYGVLGEATNLAARLMQAARPGQILLSEDLGTLGAVGIALRS
ncbi:MAG TPA: adenylate/guanylate cyclase domain-containing protein, partial [Herpetosiphonaceae bacterium]|nr:adenylate/guanylate cyclase domain-containing protein [Herpetosiphonaceae bacterium]